jgi:HEPN domain-containing protein
MKSETQEWVKKAEDDLRVANHEMEYDQPSYDAICFHSQQCAEKYLKGYLTEHSVDFPRTHMLVDLLTLCLEVDKEFEARRQDLEDLNIYGVQVRYPGFDATVPAAKEAVAAATRARDFVRSKLEIK